MTQNLSLVANSSLLLAEFQVATSKLAWLLLLKVFLLR